MFDILASGLVMGAAYASLGICVTLLSRMGGVVNFSQSATGLFGCYTTLVLTGTGTAIWLAVLAGILVGAITGALSGVVMARWFGNADIRTRSSVAIALMIGFLSLGSRIFGDKPRDAPGLFAGLHISIGNVNIAGGLVVSLLVSILLAVALDLFITRTHSGTRLQAFAENPLTAELIGIPSGALTVLVWMIAGAISSLALIIIISSTARNANYMSLSLLIIPALCASLIGGFSNFYWTLLGGLLLGLLESAVLSAPSLAPFAQVIYLPAVMLVLCWTKRKETWDAQRA
ncbi:amino acid/amide ABC transporter membrane protein 1 (HAAT family) [Paraburkholderia silvatlantica]|uniref:Amino acid/amide ABC transporter membrane protein 1 (HAAT family) n=1 Tax=Paraburkholderia silvatlantica TaxID=321895 RepID=A0A2V4TCD5_9BURK|nr:branched-chain amino acid ABC transporter permease [Paraburkholderia silvatlantica]PYE21481.1 amino acid/amide ABC transporter membrane protein 1 (HAAT family) [Paraburkholderia silvatlantica]